MAIDLIEKVLIGIIVAGSTGIAGTYVTRKFIMNDKKSTIEGSTSDAGGTQQSGSSGSVQQTIQTLNLERQ